MSAFIRKARQWLLIAALTVTPLSLAAPLPGAAEPVAPAEDEEIFAAKPYMGWSSYSMQVYTGDGKFINADNIKAQSDAMRDKLQPYGYEYINIDAGWNGSNDEYGRPIPSTTLYPDGLQDVIDYVHANGQKIGLYGIPGVSKDGYAQDLPIYNAPGCSMQDIAAQPLRDGDYWGYTYQMDFSSPCSQKYIDSIADLYGEWGIDFLKYDSVTPGSGISDLSMDARDDVKAWSQALAPYDIWLELSWALDIKYIDHWKKYAQGWRIDWDVECYCGDGGLTSWPNIKRLFPLAEKFWRHAGPGGWNDFDSLNVGNGEMDGITEDQRRTAMTFWSLSSAQLYIGNDMTNLDEYGLELLTNEEVIAINQAGRPGHPVSTETEQQVWYANNGDGTFSVGLFNLSDETADVSVDWQEIGLDGSASVRDVWEHAELGTHAEGFTAEGLPPHASRLLKVTALGGTATANDDDTGMRYSGDWTREGGRELAGGEQNLVIDITDANALDSVIEPRTASFDKKPEAQADVKVELALNGNTLTGISHRGVSLVEGTDYTVAGQQVTISKAYLAAKPAGMLNLTFTFSGGAPQQLAIAISNSSLRDSRVYPATVNYDQLTQGAVSVTTELNGNTLVSVQHGNETLVEGQDYTVSGQRLTLSPELLGELDTGTTALTFTFSAGPERRVSLVVRDTSAGGSISLNDTDPGIVYSGVWNRSYNRGLGDYMDDVHFAERDDQDSFSYTFHGTGIEYITELDPSQGEVDIYIDDEYQMTVSTHHIGRLAQQPVYAITGLEDGEHTLKAVKKSGIFMLLDKLRVLLPDLLDQTVVDFDKAEGEQIDIIVGLTTDRDLEVVRSGEDALTAGSDYVLEDGSVTIHRTYLASQPVDTLALVFGFEGGAQQTLVVEIADSTATNSTISPTAGAFDKQASLQEDIRTTLTLADNTLVRISNGSYILTEGTDYLIEGDEVVIQASYLGGLPVGSASLRFGFSEGASQILTVTITDTTVPSAAVVPATASFDKAPGAQADVTTEIRDNGHTLTGISHQGETLQEGDDYELYGGLLTIRRAYLDGQSEGMVNLSLHFSGGEPQTLAVAVTDSSRGRYTVVNNDDSDIFYKGAWQHSRNRGLGNYRDDVHFTETDGDYLEFTFQGTGISLVTEMDPAHGDMDIYIDGELIQRVSTYAPQKQAGETVFSIAGLEAGEHTIKAVKRSGYFMLLDQLTYRIQDLISPDTGSFEKSQPAPVTTELLIDGSNLLGIRHDGNALAEGTDYTVDGDQITISSSYLATQPVGTLQLSIAYQGDYMGDLHQTETNGDSVAYIFTGTGVTLLMPKSPEQGEIDIYVDGTLRETVSAHHASRMTQQAVYTVNGLTPGRHTIQAVKASGEVMLIDGVRVQLAGSTPPVDPPTNPPVLPPVTGGPGVTPEPQGEQVEVQIGGDQIVTVHRTPLASGGKRDELTLTQEQARIAAADAKARGLREVVLIIPDSGDDVAETEVRLARESLAAIADAGLGLRLVTRNASISVDGDTLAAQRAAVTFLLKPVKDEQGRQAIANRSSAQAAVRIITGEAQASVVARPVTIETNLNPAYATIMLPLGGSSDADDVAVYMEHSDGSLQLLRGEETSYDEQNTPAILFATNHFSLFTLLHADGVGASSLGLPYMQGYEDGSFRPGNQVSRAEIATIFSRILTRHAATKPVIDYTDVASTHWANDAIDTVTGIGLMQGYGDRSFGPGRPVTRAELARLVSPLLSATDRAGAGFSDTADHWAAAEIVQAQAAGLLDGYPDGTFRPNQPLTRAEAVKVINGLLGRIAVMNATGLEWQDVPASHWAYGEIAAATAR
ncbi:X2-like carbohydrate binding domain-containing protein [Paenibacillus daejeonensis]|uniref:X2-like carbohydrate binding domain-containing protein n=1 Tax=Paenibacillus daejeonensis TaxID=135193 RepID=UPI000360777C|nr:X2-like carbohydrate binding domain-containing protein [Paenibacillus daejeonensis]